MEQQSQKPQQSGGFTGSFSFGVSPQTGQSSASLPTFGTLGGGDAGLKSSKTSITPFAAAKPQQTVTPLPATTTSITSGLLASTTTSTTTSAQTTTITSNTTTSLSTATKTTDSSNTAASPINFSQLEEHINKWTLELEEQQKNFTNQATTVNAWDKLLIANNDKIMKLNEEVKRIQADQKSLEQELEFIATQHSEVEESIIPLQKELSHISQVDVERTQTYLLVENLDTQLRQMTEDLKEVIDYLNEVNKSQDNNDPISQIGKILNAHMSSLQWIETSSSAIGQKLEELSKIHETLKKDYDKSNILSLYE